ncbi:hypothetical protein ACA910_021072 [Epithemia clementina (nom. ined.)]
MAILYPIYYNQMQCLHHPTNSNSVSTTYHQPQQIDADACLVTRITTQMDKAVALALASTNNLQMQQQRLISLLIDVLLQQPDDLIVDMIIGALGRHGITAYHFIPKRTHQQSVLALTGGAKREHLPRNSISQPSARCLVRLGPLVLELCNEGGYCDLLRGARDLCRLKHQSNPDTMTERAE